MSTFPTSIPSYLGFTAGHTLLTDSHAAQHNQEQADITAIAQKVGTGSSTPVSNVVLTGSGVGTSAWSQVNLATTVTGVLPVANGGNGTISTTGTGSAVFATGPSVTGLSNTGGLTNTGGMTTNTLSVTSNTTVGGTLGVTGVLTPTGGLSAGSVNFAALLSTIFSGQVQTQVNVGTAGGNLYWINLGGIKLLWAKGASQTVGTGGAQYTFTLPAFLTTISSVLDGTAAVATSANQYHNIDSATTSSVAYNARSDTNGSSITPTIFVIGT